MDTSSELQSDIKFTYCGKEELTALALEAICSIAQKSIDNKSSFHFVLAGGRTPLSIYQLLRKTKQQWGDWHIYFGDERCLPKDNHERNSKIVKDVWLDHVSIPPEQIYIIPSEVGAKNAARSYLNTIRKSPIFDMVLLGLGEDGHTASLFPGNQWGVGNHSNDVLPVYNSPKPPKERITLSANRLSQSQRVIFLVSGDAKRDALLSWMGGDNIPAAAIHPLERIDVYYDTVLG